MSWRSISHTELTSTSEADGERGAGRGVGVARAPVELAQVLRQPAAEPAGRRQTRGRRAQHEPHGQPALRPRRRQPQPLGRPHAQLRQGLR